MWVSSSSLYAEGRVKGVPQAWTFGWSTPSPFDFNGVDVVPVPTGALEDRDLEGTVRGSLIPGSNQAEGIL